MPVDIFAEPQPIELYGKIVDLRYEMVSYTDDKTGEEVEREVIVLEIQDMAHDLDWNHTPRFTRSTANKQGSKWQSLMTHMTEIGHPVKGTEDLVNHCFRFNTITLNPEKGQYASKNYHKPVRHFESEAACIAAAKTAETEGDGDGSGGGVAISVAHERLAEIANGKTFNQILQTVLADDDLKGDSEFVSALITKGPLNDLVAAGLLTLDGEKYEGVTS